MQHLLTRVVWSHLAVALCAAWLSGASLNAQSCALYPIALPAQALAGRAPGDVLADVLQGTQSGNFGWLTWAGSPSVPTLVASLTPPGNSSTYVNPDNSSDHQINVGDWVQGKPGVSNSKNVRDALDALKLIDITVPVWDQTRGQGQGAAYRVSAFARLRLLSYQLPGQNRITAQFLGYETCDAVNEPPVVSAGPDQTISLPASASLNGTVTDDGLPAGGSLTVSWSVVSGPGTVTFANASAAATTASFSADGTYVLQLTASDSQLGANDDVIITVDRENQAPLANSQSLTNLEDAALDIVLTGSDPDADSLSFFIVTSPSHGELTGLPPNVRYTPFADYNGSDSFTFKVNDGLLDSPVATITITNLPVNDAPVADSQSLTNFEDTPLPVTLSGADVEGNALTFLVVNGPSHGTLTLNPPLPNSQLVTYTPATNYNGPDSFTFTVNDGQLDSAPATISIEVISVNDVPIVNAGPDQLVTLPANSITLAGTVTDDFFDGSTLLVAWTVVSGPGTVTFADATTNHTTASFSASGIYVLRLTADDGFLQDYDDAVITVNAPPLVHAGTNQIITLPDAASLNGAASDDGLPTNGTFTVNWSKVTGPGTVVFSDPAATNTTASFGDHGVYMLRLIASDGVASATNDVTVTVNRAPIVDAGSDQTNRQDRVTLLQASVSDEGLPVGGTLTIQWSGQGPGNVFFADRNATNTTATFSTPGVYVLTATASDGLATNQDQVVITVTAPNTAPMVSAGQGQLVYLPAGATLNGAVQDDGIPAGAIITTAWSLVSGPGTVTLGNTSATNTSVTFSTAGNYVLRLTADDTELTNSAQVTFAVRNPAVNAAPIVNAGRDKTVGLTNVVTLCGSVSDDGLPQGASLSASWSVVSGPGTVTFDNASLTNSRATFGALGTYVLRLTATDTALTTSDDVSITVYPVNNPPVVNAGADQTILVPDPALLSEDGSVSLTPQVELSVSLSSLARWNNTIGQPGLTGFPAGASNVRMGRNALALDGTNVYAAGLFRLAGGQLVKGIARWDGAQWFPLYDPRPSIPTNPASPPIGFISWDHTEYVDSVVTWGGEVFATGYLKDLNQNGVIDFSARWDGAGWNPWGVRLLYAGQFFRSVVTSPRYLYLGGNFVFQPVDGNLGSTLLPGVPYSYNITRWDGTNWTTFGQGVRDIRDSTATGPADPSDTYTNWYSYVFAIAEGKNGDVFAAGEFAMITPTGVASNIARWDGTNWSPLGLGLSGCSRFACRATINALAIGEDGSLYAGGDFAFAGGVPANDVARWDGTNWHALGSGPANGADNEVITLAVRGKDVYVGGNFNNAGGFASRSIARWNGQFWSPLGPGPTNGVLGLVQTLAVDDTGLYVGGDFSNAGGLTAAEIAKWEFSKPPPTGADLTGSATDDGLPMDAGLSFLWTKVSGPGTVTFVNPTNALTTARFSAAGTYVLRLTASDSDLTGSDELTIEVIANAAPVVTANSGGTVGAFESFPLQGAVSDDGLPSNASVVYVWSVISTPVNAIVTFQNPAATNTSVRMDRTGVYLLRLTANDSHFSSYADVIVTVQGNNTAPAPNLFSYTSSVTLPSAGFVQAAASDDGRPVGITNILWSVVSGPAPVAFSNATAVGTPVFFTTAGSYRLRLTVSDTELTANTDFNITVSGPTQPPFTGNNAPAVNAGLDLTVVARRPFALAGSASDDGLPAGSALFVSWGASNNVDRPYFDDARQPVTTAIINTPGTYILRLTATDGQFSTTDEAIVTVVAATNEPPAVSAGLDLEVTRPQAAQLFGAVVDDGLPLAAPLISTWSVVSGPGSVVFSQPSTTNTQPFSTATFNAPGLYVLRLTASDSAFTRTDDVTITVHEGTNAPPFVSAGPDRVVAMPNLLALVTTATDDGLPSGTLEVTWSQVSGPGNATFTTFNGTWLAGFNTAGTYILRLTATDGLLTTTDDVTVTVYNAPGAPGVQIHSPLDAAILTAPTVVTGTVQSVILQSWTLQYRLKPSEDSLSAPGGEGQGEVAAWITLATGSTEVSSGPLANFDPTLLLNGIYELQLTATDIVGRTSTTDPVTLVVDRNMKVGHFTLSFNDLTIPVAGIPIQVTRTYDSRDKRAGDFGIGWTLDLKNIRLQKNRHLGRAWDQSTTGGTLPTYCIDTLKPRVVTITFPDGKVQKFEMVLAPSCQALVPLIYPDAIFAPIGGNTFGSLVPLFELNGTIVTDEQLVWGGEVPGRADFISYERLLNPPPGPADNILFNPDLFEFTSQEGYRYILSETNGLRSVTDPNGNTLTITTNGLTWTNSLSAPGGEGQGEVVVLFQRDTLGRITNIVDALGHAMTYRYDTNGDLITFTDRAGNTNGFTYDGTHQLITLADARGVEAVRNDYDEAGRILRHIDANGQQITYAHDINNRLEIITNRLGFVTLSEYDSNGNVVRAVAPDGGVTTMSYDANDNLLTTIDPLGRTNSFTYDAKDNRSSATDPLGHTTTLTYNDLRRVTSATDARGNTITNRFDARGNLLSMRDPLGRVISFSYSDSGLPLAMTNSLGHVMRYAYDEQGRLTNEVDALSHATSYARDANGNLLVQTTTRTRSDNSVETLTVSMQYDGLNRLTNTIFPDHSSVRTIYNAIGKPAVTIDQLGRQMLMDYDELGRMTRTTYPDGHSDSAAYDAEGRRIASTNRLGQVTQFNYDAVGRLFRMVYPDGTTTTNYFDLAGQLRAATDARGFNTFYGYDDAGRSVAVTNALLQVSRSVYDQAGNLIAAIDALSRTNRFFYDALNRRTNTVFADGSTASTFFDELGRRVAETDQNTNTTRFGYDELGRLRFVTNALGKVTEYRYNELGQQTQQIDANHHATTFDYDQLGRRVLRTLPGGQFETYGYNVAGLMTSKLDFNGRVTTYTYDSMNRLEQKIPDAATGEPTVSFAYNALGQRTNMVDASGSTRYGFDVRNRLVEKVKTWAAVGLSAALNYAYDAGGNLTNVASSSPNGTAIAYEHDALSRLSAVNDARLGRTTYAYDDVGNLDSYALPNGVTSLHAYDSLNRLTNLTTLGSAGGPPAVVAQYLYGLSPAGHRLSAAEAVVRAGVPQTINRVFSYDATYRLVGETINGALNSGSAGYTYDDVGNRLTRATSGFASGLLDPQSFAYDLNDRLNTDTYDANGNTLFGAGFSQTQADRYDFENRLIERRSTIASVSRTVNIAYDGDGNRVSKTVNGITTFYLVDELNPTGYAQVLEELSTLNSNPPQLLPIRLYTHGHDLLSQDQLFDTGTNLVWSASFYGYDGHGSTRYLTDASGNVTDTYDFDAYGNLTAQTGTTPNLYLYSGEQYDSDLGLYYLRARYHNPQTGRFWSVDSFEGFGEDPASLHKYTYGADNPVNCVDPTGNIFDGLTGTSIVTALAPVVRTMAQRALYGALGGAFVGFHIGFYDAITHGETDPNRILDRMLQGAVGGAVLGGAYGAISALPGAWAKLLGTGLTGVLLAEGAAEVGKSFGEGHYVGGAFRTLLLGIGVKLGIGEARLAYNEFYSRVSLPSGSRVPGGGLEAHEGVLGAHTIDKHVGKTEMQLQARLAAEPQISASSSFYNLQTADHAVATTLAAHRGTIAKWLAGNAQQSPALRWQMPSEVGISIGQGAPSAIPVSGVRVYLIRNPSSPTGFTVYTSYPEL